MAEYVGVLKSYIALLIFRYGIHQLYFSLTIMMSFAYFYNLILCWAYSIYIRRASWLFIYTDVTSRLNNIW
jgi:hypothetical protein